MTGDRPQSDQKQQEILDLVRAKIENLRPKLLDLSRRNPLIATRFSSRSTSHVRVVDELPDVLSFRLANQQQMKFAPLPALDEDPKDELTKEFRDALAEARLTDEVYLSDSDSIDSSHDDSLEKIRKLERSLKDRVRTSMGLPPRQTRQDISFAQHARNNGISPSYDLPDPREVDDDGRYSDDSIQTLLLPEDLVRVLNGLSGKCRTWMQETGLNVLHAAFGFLEWNAPNETTVSLSPLVLSPVEIVKVKTSEGPEFWVKGTGEELEANSVLAEKLRLEFGVTLPPFEGGSVEDYCSSISALAPKGIKWQVRRQVAIGVFPSARMAMYHDLETVGSEFEGNPTLLSLLGGAAGGADSPFADTYDVDNPEIESSVPCLVLDADSSQFSAMVDIAHGKNLALEGPPGTGKSQTIVNTIAAAIAEGKKVLFVAEKMAALDVVKSRLEAVGLGEFVLPLQAERSTREQVMQSVRDRVEMSVPRVPKGYDEKIVQYKALRGELSAYIETISQEFGTTGLKVYEIIGRGIAANSVLEDAPKELLVHPISNPETLNLAAIESISRLAKAVEKTWSKAQRVSGNWRGVSVDSIDRFTVEQAADLAERAGVAFEATAQSRRDLESYGVGENLSHGALQRMYLASGDVLTHLQSLDPLLVRRVHEEEGLQRLNEFLELSDEWRRLREEIAHLVVVPQAENLAEDLSRLLEIAEALAIDPVSAEVYGRKFRDVGAELAHFDKLLQALDSLSFTDSLDPDVSLEALSKAREIIETTPRDVLHLRERVSEEKLSGVFGRKIIHQGLSLKERHNDLKGIFVVDRCSDASQFAEMLATMRSSGPFRLFSGEYRKARRSYLAFTKREEFDLKQAISDLAAVADFKNDEKKFLENPAVPTFFGHLYDGLDTEFELFEQLAQYYSRVDEELQGGQCEFLRGSLKSADIKPVREVPEIHSSLAGVSLGELRRKVKHLRSQLDVLSEYQEKFYSLTKVLRDGAPISRQTLSNLLKLVKRFSLLGSRLQLDEFIAKLLGRHFCGGETGGVELTASMAVNRILSDLEDEAGPILHALDEGSLPNLHLKTKEALLSDEKTASALKELCEHVGWKRDELVGDKSNAALAEFLLKSAKDTDGFLIHAEYALRKREFESLGFGWISEILLEARQSLDGLPEMVSALISRAQSQAVYRSFRNVLGKTSGARLDECRKQLADIDREVIRMSRKYLRAKASLAAKPDWGTSTGKKSSWTGMALIENEINKKQRFIPVRDFTRRAGKALQELKPCWMMSPLAVAQYLPKGELKFDLTIIDEASQMPPEDAIGAIARSSQVMVVGDTNQLPPTSFFRKMLEDDDADEDESVLDESILEMANAAFRPRRRLRWHYRSRHSGLIKFSNHFIYNNDLVVFPSAQEGRVDMGVSLVRVAGRYKAGTNPDEAHTMIEAVLRFMRERPDESLGVVTLNQKQRDLLLEEMQYALDRDSVAAKYVERWQKKNDGLEEFFIKNLENVQGDERDVIFIGTVYGPEVLGGPVMQRFGPINGVAGKRRLNVLFSRAKRQVVTFSSMTASDIKADEDGNVGAYMLKKWLEYSASGLLPEQKSTGKAPDSDFEIFVMDQVRSMGCEPVPQVGVVGYSIDIGVRHPDWPYGFLLGVECDGASYHSSKSARDRDRLRQEVLEGLGWHIHRIWSTDWFNDPRREAERLRVRIEERLKALKEREADYCTPASSAEEKWESMTADLGVENATTQTVIKDEEPHHRQSVVDEKDETSIKRLGADVGDRVRVRYLSGDGKTLEVTLSSTENAPDRGVIHIDQPLGEALLGVEDGEEIEVLVGSYVRKAVVESVLKLT